MKRIGLVTGLGPASTVDYYLGIINGYRRCLNTESYPEIVMFNVDMNRMFEYTNSLDYEKITEYFLETIERLKVAGATAAAICCNTLHIVYDKLADKSVLPVLSIIEATCKETAKRGFRNVLLLGTAFTMNSDMYPKAMIKHGIDISLPDIDQREQIQSIIFPELEEGIVNPIKKLQLLNMTEKIIEREKAEAVILGCTELPLMIKHTDLSVDILNTTDIHINMILDYLTRD